MEDTLFGWREGILLLVSLAVAYLGFLVLRLFQVGRRRSSSAAAAERAAAPAERSAPTLPPDDATPMAAPAFSAGYAVESVALPAEPAAVPPPPTFEWDEVKSLFGEDTETPAAASPPAPRPAVAGGFGEHLAEHLARSEMEVEVQRMRSEMERMRNEVEELRAARRVSPQYAEAMELAQRGLTARDLADRLGISLGEAELVYALSRGDRNFDEGEEHGAEQFATGNEYDRYRQPGG